MSCGATSTNDTHPRPLPKGGERETVRGERILSLVQAPSLWEGWGGLLVVYRIIYPHTPCRRIAYPPEQGHPPPTSFFDKRSDFVDYPMGGKPPFSSSSPHGGPEGGSQYGPYWSVIWPILLSSSTLLFYC